MTYTILIKDNVLMYICIFKLIEKLREMQLMTSNFDYSNGNPHDINYYDVKMQYN